MNGFFLIAIFWLAAAALDYGEFCYLWQLKEYRMDRMRDFFASVQGKKYWKAGLSFSFRRPRMPVFTPKAVLLIVIALGAEAATLFFFRHAAIFVGFLFVRFYLFSGVVLFFGAPTRMLKHIIVRRAQKKLSAFPKLLVIGITGSYGKTAVKTILAHILSGAKCVIATPEHLNTDIGVARFILKTDFTNTDIFIVEMGAYQIGEIQALCDMVRPTIGILTAINEQHLSLFGSIKNIQQAKYELLRSLPQSGLAVTNRDNPYCTEFLSQLRAPSKTFPASENIQSANIAPCLIVAEYLGMSTSALQDRLRTIPTINLKTHSLGLATIIDDTYNSNPDGFRAALRTLASLGRGKRRIVVTRGMLELGDKSDELHESIGEEIGNIADTLVVITPDAFEPLKRGAVKGGRTEILRKENPAELLRYLQSLRSAPAVILLENRLPKTVYEHLS